MLAGLAEELGKACRAALGGGTFFQRERTRENALERRLHCSTFHGPCRKRSNPTWSYSVYIFHGHTVSSSTWMLSGTFVSATTCSAKSSGCTMRSGGAAPLTSGVAT